MSRQPIEASARRFRRYPEYRDSGIQWLGKIPKHWRIGRLKATVTGSQNGLWGAEPDGINDIICIRVADFDREELRVNIGEPTLRSIEKSALRGRILKPGDLLLEKSGGGEKQPVGAVVLYDYSEPAVCSNFIARMPVAEGFFPRYLAYLHNAAYSARLNTRSIKQSTGIQNLDSDAYLAESACFPPYSEQRAIARFLDRETAKIDALVAGKERLIELLQDQRNALIARAVTRGLDSNVSMKDSGVELLGTIPAHWRPRRMAYLAKSVSGGTPNKGNPEYWQGEIPWVSPKDMKTRVISDTADHISPSAVSEAGLVVVDPPAVLIVVRGMILAHSFPVAYTTTAVTINQDMKALLVGAELDARYLTYLLEGLGSSLLSLVEEAGHGTKRLRTDLWRSIKLDLPPLEEQLEIIAYLDGELTKIAELVKRIASGVVRLQDLRTTLISEAVTGKIDVRKETT